MIQTCHLLTRFFLSTHSNNPSTCGWTSVSPGNIRPILIDHGLPPVSVCPSVRSITPLFKFLRLPLLFYTVVDMFHVSALSTFLKPNISIISTCHVNIAEISSMPCRFLGPQIGPRQSAACTLEKLDPTSWNGASSTGKKVMQKAPNMAQLTETKKKCTMMLQCQKYIQNIDTLVKMR